MGAAGASRCCAPGVQDRIVLVEVADAGADLAPGCAAGPRDRGPSSCSQSTQTTCETASPPESQSSTQTTLCEKVSPPESEESAAQYPTESDGQTSVEGVGQASSDEGEAIAARSWLRRVRELCLQGRVFDAIEELRVVEREIADVADVDEIAAAVAQAELDGDDLVAALQGAYARIDGMSRQMGLEALMDGDGREASDRWARVTVRDPELGDAFEANLRVRFAVGGERRADGPSCQLVAQMAVTGFPLDLEKAVAVWRETDLYRKEWVQDCEHYSGEVAGAEKMYAAWSHIVNAAPLLPVKLDVLTVRDFSVCPEGCELLRGRGPGVLIAECSPPGHEKSFAGWALPPVAPWTSRVPGASFIIYITPTPGRPGYSDMYSVCRTGLPVPQWLLPLGLLKKFVGNSAVASFRNAKRHIIDDWEALGYSERISGSPEFYEAICGMRAP